MSRLPITRETDGDRFVYRESGRRITSVREVARLDSLAIPPAWTDVESHIREARSGARAVSSYATHTGDRAPASGAQRGSTW